MPSARPSSFASGGLLRGVDGTITGLVFTDAAFSTTAVKSKPKPGAAPFKPLNARLTILPDGAEESIERSLFVGNALDYEFEGATVTGEKAFSRTCDWYIFLNSAVTLSTNPFPEEAFPDDDPNVADYTALLGARFRFDWQKNDAKTKKLGQVVSKKDATKKYDREDLIVTAYYGQEEVQPAKGAKTTAKKTTVAKGGKPNGAAQAVEVSVPDLAEETVLQAVNAATNKKLTKSKLSVKILTALSKADADVREEVRTWAFNDENLKNIEGLVYDPATQTLSAAAA